MKDYLTKTIKENDVTELSRATLTKYKMSEHYFIYYLPSRQCAQCVWIV